MQMSKKHKMEMSMKILLVFLCDFEKKFKNSLKIWKIRKFKNGSTLNLQVKK